MTEWILLSVVFALVSLTNQKWGLFFFGEPLVSGALTGFLIQDVSTGLYLGAVIQFMWLNSVPVGVKVQSNYTIMTLFSVWLVHKYGIEAFPLAFAAGYCFAMLSRQIDVLNRKLNNSLSDHILRNIDRINLTALNFLYMAAYTTVLFLLILGGLILSNHAVLELMPLIPTTILAAFASAYLYLPLYALSLFFHAVSIQFKLLYMLAGLAAVIFLMFFRTDTRIGLFILAGLAFVIPLVEGRLLLLRRTSHDS